MKRVHFRSTWYCAAALILVVYFENVCGKKSPPHWEKRHPDNFAAMSDKMDRHKIFSNPLTKGIYVFDKDGFLPEEPLKRLRKIHMQMMQAIASMQDMNTRAKYLVTLSNSANTDIQDLRTKIQDAGIVFAEDLEKTKVKGDAFMLMLSHAALVSNSILYFPDIMHSLLRRSPEFETNFKWVIHFSVSSKLTQSKVHLKLFDLAQQEIGLIPKKPNYKNPFKNLKTLTTTPAPTTKRPRKRFEPRSRMTKTRAEL